MYTRSMNEALVARLTAWLESAEFNLAHAPNESQYAYYRGTIATLKDTLELLEEQ